MQAAHTGFREDVLKAIGHPTRLAILDELLRGVKCVNVMAELLDRPQPNVSQHLAALRRIGLVACAHDGLFRCYYLAKPDLVRDLMAVLARDYPTRRPSPEDLERARQKRRERPRRG